MNKKINININQILFSLVIFFSFFFCINCVNANTISKIDMDVYIDKNGNASVTEVWKANLTSGTEGYRPYFTNDNATISDFSVSDDSGKNYESISSWNIKASFENKAYKCGINKVNDGVELCWGISNYGNRTYTLKYNINNFVNQYTDKQGIYINFLKLDNDVGNVRINIHSDTKFFEDNAKIWAFGNNGTIHFVDGNIVLESGGRLTKSQYIVGLIKLESNLFNTKSKINKSFDDVYNEAFSDVKDKEIDKDENINNNVSFLLPLILLSPIMLLFNPVVIIIIIVLILKKVRSTSGESLDFGNIGNILPSDDEINYFRDIPCNKDLERAYWVCYNYNVVSKETLKQGIIGAILLNWIRDGYITVTKTKKGLFSFKDNNYAIDFTKMKGAKNEIESELFKMLVTASGNNGILEAKEFERWCKNNYSKVNLWFSNIIRKEEFYLENQGLIVRKNKECKGIFGNTKIVIVKCVSEKLRDEAIQLKGLKKFLNDFSMMPERQYFEVHIWEEYLMFSELFGIADKVEEQFSKLYPKFNQESLLNTDVSTVAIRNMVSIGYKAVVDGNYRATSHSSSTSDSSYSSGGGGRSYHSGGSSAGGSSGGGFR